jgi:hypothetical protein
MNNEVSEAVDDIKTLTDIYETHKTAGKYSRDRLSAELLLQTEKIKKPK